MGVLYFLLSGFLVLCCLHYAAGRYAIYFGNPGQGESRKLPKGKKVMIVDNYQQFLEPNESNVSVPPKAVPIVIKGPNPIFNTGRRGKRKTSALSHRKKR